jgi:hypothetical protein
MWYSDMTHPLYFLILSTFLINSGLVRDLVLLECHDYKVVDSIDLSF